MSIPVLLDFCCLSVWFVLPQCLVCVAVFGFVHFTDETEQQRCMIEQNNTDLNGKRIVCRAARQQQYQSAGSYGQNLPPVSSAMLDIFNTGIFKNTQSKSYTLPLTECVWDFQSKAFCDTH